MTTGQTPTPISEATISTVEQKLQAWAQGLPPEEQAVLAQILAQASVADRDSVQGYFMGGSGDFSIWFGWSRPPTRLCPKTITLTYGPWGQYPGGSVNVTVYYPCP